jgi:hypothetical protein
MNDRSPASIMSRLRWRLIDDATIRRFSRDTLRNYIREVWGVSRIP